jgi:hypothetical protein
LGGGDRKDWGLPAQANDCKTPILTDVWVQLYVPVISVMQGSTNRRSIAQAGPGIKQYLISKIINAKRTSGMAQTCL